MLLNTAKKKYPNTLHTHYEIIYQGYHDHSFKHNHEYRRQEKAIQPHEMGGITWLYKEKKNNISNNDNSNNKIMQSAMESITVLHLTFLHFNFQYLEQRQVIRIHIG